MARKASQPVIETANDNAENSGKRRAKKERPVFDLTTALDVDGNSITLDEDGRLTAVPANWETTSQKLKRGQFASREVYYDFLILLVDRQSQRLAERRQELLEQREGKVNEKVKAMRQIERLRKKIALLEAAMDGDDEVE